MVRIFTQGFFFKVIGGRMLSGLVVPGRLLLWLSKLASMCIDPDYIMGISLKDISVIVSSC